MHLNGNFRIDEHELSAETGVCLKDGYLSHLYLLLVAVELIYLQDGTFETL